jgi:calcium-dependent protein kinase
MVTKEEKKELTEAFKALDANGDGKITMEELKQGYDRNMGGITDAEMKKLMNVLDNDGSGSISYSEFIAAAINREKVLTKEKIENCFNIFDKVGRLSPKDKSGSISISELKRLFAGNKKVTEEVWKEMLGEIDDNGDGEVGQVHADPVQ